MMNLTLLCGQRFSFRWYVMLLCASCSVLHNVMAMKPLRDESSQATPSLAAGNAALIIRVAGGEDEEKEPEISQSPKSGLFGLTGTLLGAEISPSAATTRTSISSVSPQNDSRSRASSLSQSPAPVAAAAAAAIPQKRSCSQAVANCCRALLVGAVGVGCYYLGKVNNTCDSLVPLASSISDKASVVIATGNQIIDRENQIVNGTQWCIQLIQQLINKL